MIKRVKTCTKIKTFVHEIIKIMTKSYTVYMHKGPDLIGIKQQLSMFLPVGTVSVRKEQIK